MSFLFDRQRSGNGKRPPALPALPSAAKAEPAPMRPVPLATANGSGSREPRCPGIYQPPGSCDRPDTQVDANLGRKIRRHFADNFTPKRKARRPSPVLFLVGATGIGKTMTAETVASRNGIGVLKIAGADMGGSDPFLEGAPVQTINAALTWIDWNDAVNQQKTCLLIDDIDASIVPERPGTTGTNNTDQVRGKFQTIADRADAPCQIWTGNSSHHFHRALLRAGRCELFRYDPDAATTAALIEHIFQPANDRDRRHIQKIAHKYRHQPIAWFSNLRFALIDDAIDALLDRVGLDFEALQTAPDPADHLDIDALYAAAARADATQGGDFSH